MLERLPSKERPYIFIKRDYLKGYLDPRTLYWPHRNHSILLNDIANGTRVNPKVKILCRVDQYRYVLYKMSIPKDEYKNRVWIDPEGIVINQNQYRKNLIRELCTKTRKWCVGWAGDISHEFFSICPKCDKVFVAVKEVDVPCDSCGEIVPYKDTNTFIKYPCSVCAAIYGIADANSHIEWAKKNLHPRLTLNEEATKMVKEEILSKVSKINQLEENAEIVIDDDLQEY